MVILTSYTSATYKAQIRSSPENGFKQIYTGTCTESEKRAAENLVRKWYGDAAAATVQRVNDPVETIKLAGDFFADPSRKQVFGLWTFDMSAKDSPAKSPLVQRAEALREARSSSHQLSTLDSQPLEVVTASQVDAAELDGLAEAITRSREIIHKHESLCHETTLEHYLDAGQQLARAQEIFTLSQPGNRNPSGKNQHSSEALSTVDKASPESPEILAIRGFSAWLADALPDLKRPTAIRYATAYRSLGLPLTAKPAEIRAKLKTLRHQAGKDNLPMPTLAALVKAAPKPPKPEALTVLVPKSSKQLKLEDARETFGLWMQSFDKALKQGHLDNLDRKGLEQLKEFSATVRDRINARLK